MEAPYMQTPPELVFPAHVPFSWTLRSAWARRIKAETAAPRVTPYRIAGFAGDARALAAVIAFCDEHDATLELADRV